MERVTVQDPSKNIGEFLVLLRSATGDASGSVNMLLRIKTSTVLHNAFAFATTDDMWVYKAYRILPNEWDALPKQRHMILT